MSPKPTSVQAKVDIPTSGLPAPEAANWFNVSHNGGEVQVLVGYLDLYSIAMMAQRLKDGTLKDDPSIKPDVTHRLMMSVNGLLFLRAQIDEIFQKMRDAGFIGEVSSPTPTGGARAVR